MKDYDYEIYLSEYENHVSEIISKYIEPTRFYSVGGDGFLNQVIQSLVHTSHELVVIPYGTGNDFSRFVNTSKKASKVLQRSLTCHSKKVDVVKMNQTYFINVACFGLDAVIGNTVHEIDQFGKYSYIASIFRNIKSYPFYEVELKENNQTLYKGAITICALTNGQYYGGGFCIAPHSSLNDGYLDIIILPHVKKLHMLYYIMKILRKTLYQSKKTFITKVKTCDIYTYAAINMDGEKEQSHHYHFEVIPLSINLVA